MEFRRSWKRQVRLVQLGTQFFRCCRQAEIQKYSSPDICTTLKWLKCAHTKQCAYLGISHELLNFQNGWIHMLNIIQVRKYESFRHIEAASNDIFDIFKGQSTGEVIMNSSFPINFHAKYLWHSSSFKSCLNKNFSSSVSWITKGQSKASWSHYVTRARVENC